LRIADPCEQYLFPAGGRTFIFAEVFRAKLGRTSVGDCVFALSEDVHISWSKSPVNMEIFNGLKENHSDFEWLLKHGPPHERET
jgi:hypothetical protein